MTEDKIKAALQRIPYGFYAIGSRSDDDLNIMVANWLMQTSFTPRQVAFGLSKTAHTHAVISAGRVFSVSIFNATDDEIIKGFTRSRAKNPDKVKDASFTAGPQTGCPIIDGAAAWLECRVINIVDSGGDHDIIVGEVLNADVPKAGETSDTLTLYGLGWNYAG